MFSIFQHTQSILPPRVRSGTRGRAGTVSGRMTGRARTKVQQNPCWGFCGSENTRRRDAGFTLIELLIAMSLFLVVLVIASGTFVQSLKSQRAATELIAINDNASGTLEVMAREIRTGIEFSVPSKTELRFTNANGKKVIYQWNEADGTIEKKEDNGSFERVTATNVTVKRLVFVGSGLGGNDKKQSKITIGLEIGGKSKILEDAAMRLQTTISPRAIDG